MTYDLRTKGNVARIDVEFTLFGTSTYVDPDAVYLTVEDPDGVETVYQFGVDSEITKTDTGKYRGAFPLDAAGMWTWCWWSTGSGQAATSNGQIKVEDNLAGSA